MDGQASILLRKRGLRLKNGWASSHLQRIIRVMPAPCITSTMTTLESTFVLLDYLQRVPCALAALGWCRTAARQRNESGATLSEKNDGAPTCKKIDSTKT